MSISSQYVSHVEESIRRAQIHESSILPSVLEIDGMSSSKMRHLMNNLLRLPSSRRVRYLEVGSWKGSTFCSAIANNDIDATSIDNFSQFTDVSFKGENEHPKVAFHRNLSQTLTLSNPRAKVDVIQADSFTVNTALLGQFDVYFYDGEHSFDSQYRAFTYFNPCISDTCIIVVDDCNDENAAREMTKKGLAESGRHIVKDWLLFGGNQPLSTAFAEWWNGVYIAVVTKA